MDVVAQSARDALSILLVLALLGVAVWRLRKGGSVAGIFASKAARKTRSLEAAERLALTPQHALHLIRVQGREIVIATHPQGCTVIENAEARL